MGFESFTPSCYCCFLSQHSKSILLFKTDCFLGGWDHLQCEKLRKKRNAFMGPLRIAHGNSIDEVDKRILNAR